MSSKDESIFTKDSLMSTHAGRDILRHAMLKSKQYKQFQYYKEYADKHLTRFVERFGDELYESIMNDDMPEHTLQKFVNEIGSKELMLDANTITTVRDRLEEKSILEDRVSRIVDSNFVKMTYPVFRALVEGANDHLALNLSEERMDMLVDAHIIAIDLSEPMDRIIDMDEDREYLDDYRLMNPYILEIARNKISEFGERVIGAFEEGFRDAMIGQYTDHRLKMSNRIDYESMLTCYKKYRAIMGTAGRNMALSINPLGEILYYGMAKAGESVGCGNEMEDSFKQGVLKIPSWPLYYKQLVNDEKRAFTLTLERAEMYLEEARQALDMLPDGFSTKPFIEFLFLTVRHYNQYWYNQVAKL